MRHPTRLILWFLAILGLFGWTVAMAANAGGYNHGGGDIQEFQGLRQFAPQRQIEYVPVVQHQAPQVEYVAVPVQAPQVEYVAVPSQAPRSRVPSRAPSCAPRGQAFGPVQQRTVFVPSRAPQFNTGGGGGGISFQAGRKLRLKNVVIGP